MRCSLLTLSCYLDDELETRRRGELEAHLVGCPRCRGGLGHLREEVERVGSLARVRVPAHSAHALLVQTGVVDEDAASSVAVAVVEAAEASSLRAMPVIDRVKEAVPAELSQWSFDELDDGSELADLAETPPVTTPLTLPFAEAAHQPSVAAPPPPEPAVASAVAPSDEPPPPLPTTPPTGGDPPVPTSPSWTPPRADAASLYPLTDDDVLEEPVPVERFASAPLPARRLTLLDRVRDRIAMRRALARSSVEELDDSVQIVSGAGAPPRRGRAWAQPYAPEQLPRETDEAPAAAAPQTRWHGELEVAEPPAPWHGDPHKAQPPLDEQEWASAETHEAAGWEEWDLAEPAHPAMPEAGHVEPGSARPEGFDEELWGAAPARATGEMADIAAWADAVDTFVPSSMAVHGIAVDHPAAPIIEDEYAAVMESAREANAPAEPDRASRPASRHSPSELKDGRRLTALFTVAVATVAVVGYASRQTSSPLPPPAAASAPSTTQGQPQHSQPAAPQHSAPVLQPAAPAATLTDVHAMGDGSTGWQVKDLRYGIHPGDFRIVLDLVPAGGAGTGSPTTTIGLLDPTTLIVALAGVLPAGSTGSLPPQDVVVSVTQLPTSPVPGTMAYEVKLAHPVRLQTQYLAGSPLRLVLDLLH